MHPSQRNWRQKKKPIVSSIFQHHKMLLEEIKSNFKNYTKNLKINKGIFLYSHHNSNSQLISYQLKFLLQNKFLMNSIFVKVSYFWSIRSKCFLNIYLHCTHRNYTKLVEPYLFTFYAAIKTFCFNFRTRLDDILFNAKVTSHFSGGSNPLTQQNL